MQMLAQFLRRRPKPPKAQAGVRLMPAVMATVAVVLGLKAVAMAEVVAEGAGGDHPAANAATTAAPAQSVQAQAQAPANQCAAPTLAEMAGLSASEVQVLQALSARRAALDARGEAYETQDELMQAAEQRLNERLAELRTLETHVNDLLGQLDQAQEARLASLVDVYQRMRAKDAAAVFDGLDDAVLVQVASRMRQANLAEVMGRMDPARARVLTQMLADRARPPTSGDDLLERARGTPAAAPAAGH
jgi:flagellar motility protein MotE (MotC chaperone)